MDHKAAKMRTNVNVTLASMVSAVTKYVQEKMVLSVSMVHVIADLKVGEVNIVRVLVVQDGVLTVLVMGCVIAQLGNVSAMPSGLGLDARYQTVQEHRIAMEMDIV